MSRTTYSAEFKAKLVLEVLKGTESLEAIASKNQITPDMLRTWKKEFVKNAARVFSESKTEREARRKEDALERARKDVQDHRTTDVGTRLSSGLLSRKRTRRPRVS